MKHLRQDWLRHRIPKMQAHPDRLVFIDETSVKTNLTRLRGRSLRGQRLEMSAPFGAWDTQTFIAGLTHDDLIAPWVIKGAMDGFAIVARTNGATWLTLRCIHPGRSCAGSATWNRRHLRQPRNASQQRRCHRAQDARLLVPIPAAVLA